MPFHTQIVPYLCRPVQVLPTQASVKDVLTVLKRTTHNAFPVVDTEPDFRRIMETDPEDKTLLPTPHYGRLRGIIGRNEIMTMISKKIFVNAHEFGLPRAKGILQIRALIIFPPEIPKTFQIILK